MATPEEKKAARRAQRETPEARAKAAAYARERRKNPALRAMFQERDRLRNLARSKDPVFLAKEKERSRRRGMDAVEIQRKRELGLIRRLDPLEVAKDTAANKKHRDDRNRKLNLLKIGRPCYDCGGMFPTECLEWDHMPGTKKLFCVAAGKGKSLETILDEIAKCQLVCSNCHHIRTVARHKNRPVAYVNFTEEK